MKKLWQRLRKNKIVRRIVGAFLIVAGVVSFVIPISPGLLLVFLGLYLIDERLAKLTKEKSLRLFKQVRRRARRICKRPKK